MLCHARAVVLQCCLHLQNMFLHHRPLYLQALPVAIPLLGAEANRAADCSSAETESQLLSDDVLQEVDIANSAAISPVAFPSVPLTISWLQLTESTTLHVDVPCVVYIK